MNTTFLSKFQIKSEVITFSLSFNLFSSMQTSKTNSLRKKWGTVTIKNRVDFLINCILTS